jgi:hypothetical protein
MGVDRGYLAGIGIMFNRNEVFPKPDKIGVPSCKHDERIGNDYCPKCGKRVGLTKEFVPDLFSGINEVLHELVVPKGFTLELTDYYSTEAPWFIGFTLENFTRFENIPFEVIRETIKAIIEDIKETFLDTLDVDEREEARAKYPELYDEARFGLHAVETFS